LARKWRVGCRDSNIVGVNSGSIGKRQHVGYSAAPPRNFFPTKNATAPPIVSRAIA
jgi:hypothetical protein